MGSLSSQGPLGMAMQLKLMLQLSLVSIVLHFRRLQKFCRRLGKKRRETSTQTEEGRDACWKDGAAGMASPTWELWTSPEERSTKLPRAPLASMVSLGSLAASSSSSFSSLYSFPEPWPGALAELAALVPRTDPEQQPEPEPEPEPALCPSPEPPALLAAAPSPLHSLGSSKQSSPRDGAQSPMEPHCSHTELILELLRVVRENQAAVERRCQLLRALLERQEAAETLREPPAQERPAQEPPAQEPPRIHLRVLMDFLSPGMWQLLERDTGMDMDIDVDTDMYMDTDKNMDVDERMEEEAHGSAPEELDQSTLMDPGRTNPAGSRWGPTRTAHLRVTPGLCGAGQCLQDCCSRLWRWVQDRWRHCRAQPFWQRWSYVGRKSL